MPNRFASGKWAIATCDRCGQQYKLKELRKLTIKTQQVNIKVCNECWEPDQPQLSLGLYPVNDPQALREPRPDTSYIVSGVNTLGSPEGGSRIIQWSWNPVGGPRADDAGLTPNNLAPLGQVGIVTVTTS
jgi:hypothetical protein